MYEFTHKEMIGRNNNMKMLFKSVQNVWGGYHLNEGTLSLLLIRVRSDLCIFAKAVRAAEMFYYYTLMNEVSS